MNDNAENLNQPDVLQGRWRSIETKFDEFANCLRRESEFATGQLKQRIMRVVKLLGQQPTRDEVLANRDALEMLLPMLGDRNDSATVETSVRMGVQRIAGNDVYRRNWLQLFWYPALVAVCAFFVCVLLSFTLAPEFEATVLEITGFGISSQGKFFPWVTRLSLGIASFLRVMWIPITVLVCTAVVVIGWINLRGRKSSSSGLGWWDDRNISVRGAVAVWTSHLASLLQVGVPQADAFDIASREAPKMSLRNLSSTLAGRERIISDSQRRPYFPLSKYAMLDHALQMAVGPAKVASLQEVARYYRDRDRFVSTWWMAWFSTGLLWMMGFLVLGIFLAMFIPLSDLIRAITGLTGGVSGLGN